MEETEVYPWNQLIDKFLAGDFLPFFEKLKFIVVHHRHFRGKTLAEIREQYEINEPEDFLQQICLRIYQNGHLKNWKNLKLSDVQINIQLRTSILNSIRDQVRKRKNKGELEQITDDIEDKRGFLSNEGTKILDAVKEKLSSRQIKILYKSKNLGIGEMTNSELALELEVSVKTVEKDIRKIKDLVSEEVDTHPFLKKLLKR